MTVTRRNFLVALGAGNYAALRNPTASSAADRGGRRKGKPGFFDPIPAGTDDQLILPPGFRYEVVCAWGDALGSKDKPDGKDELFGFNCDFTCYFPIDGREGKASSTEGLLFVNHEYPDPVFVSGYTRADYDKGVKKTPPQIRDEALSVGGSVLYVKRDKGGRWAAAHHKDYTRRLTALYPTAEFSGPAAKLATSHPQFGGQYPYLGTLANCSGGRTPWLTALTCEENYPDYNDDRAGRFGYRWRDDGTDGLNEERFGWIVEVDPYDPARPPVKHTALGRTKHEAVAIRCDGPGGRLVAYMGDDEQDQFLYKYVSDAPYAAPSDGKLTPEFRRKCRELLQHGTLYAADFENGRWLPLSLGDETSAKKLRETKVKHRGEEVPLKSMDLVLLYTREAAKALGATPLDRPEDCEVHPVDRTLYVALTNNTKRANFHGQIVRLTETNDNPEGTSFRFEVFLAGGPKSGLSCPDNLAFDKRGNLWVACDISSDKVGKGQYQPFGNNGLFVVPTAGNDAGDAYQFASAPVGAELTGPWFTDDHSTLFLAVQHPGEGSESREKPTSKWPHRSKDELPRPAVVAITGFHW